MGCTSYSRAGASRTGAITGVVRQFNELFGEVREQYGVRLPAVAQLPLLRAAHREKIFSLKNRTGAVTPCGQYMREALRTLQFARATYVRGPLFRRGRGEQLDSHFAAAVASRAGLEVSDVLTTALSSSSASSIPCHYVALDHASRCAVVAVRGTRSIEDVYTTLVCKPSPFLRGVAHQGMADSARALWARVRNIVHERVPDGYELRVVGHSLGGGIAILTAMALLLNADEFLLRRKMRVTCWAFAPPPVYNSNRPLAPRVRDRIQCFINRDDVVPKLSLFRVARLLHSLHQLDRMEWREKLHHLWARPRTAFADALAEESDRDTCIDLDHQGKIFWMWGRGDLRACKADDLRELLVSDTMIQNHMVGAYERTILEVIRGLEFSDNDMSVTSI